MSSKKLLLGLAAGAAAIWVAAQYYSASTTEDISVTMQKQNGTEWSVLYQLEKPTQRLAFVRNPDHTRVERWQPVSDYFMVAVDTATGQEFISRRDGQPFSEVNIGLTPTYTPLLKDYAPFSPFTDGGMGWFSGRFKVCPLTCDDAMRLTYDFHMQAEPLDYIRLPGQNARQSANWQESADDGVMVYVGPQAPSVNGLQSIIDPGLPQALQSSLQQDLPPIMNYFSARLGELTVRPMVMASFSSTDDGRYGQQGGVIGSQLFVHWYGHSLYERMQSTEFVNETLWFFAHEVAHLFQGNLFDNDNAWIHEGAAEFMAYEYLHNQGVSDNFLSQRLETALTLCEQPLTDEQFAKHYACGLVVAERIDQELKSDYPIGLFRLWELYQLQIEKNPGEEGADTYFRILAELTSKRFAASIQNYLEHQFSH
ncbi:hypothetical protein [Pseudidiomarina sp.]|uniref:hypothetical protein n=1 Tax=Pseudidiomarina sp. TaxID=2081707 RepID=UPI00299CEC26|nr:hypothetical protein [Pseudidiomarina sp.]MDX1705677.1 hypothetical protein [Pseudidiomarina sp.]